MWNFNLLIDSYLRLVNEVVEDIVIITARSRIQFPGWSNRTQCCPVFPLRFWLVRFCPNNKFIEIFAQRFYYFEDPFYKFFALNFLFQDTSYSLALKYFKFFSFAFYDINFWFKISKICPKISHFSQISHSEGDTGVATADMFLWRRVVQAISLLRWISFHVLA